MSRRGLQLVLTVIGAVAVVFGGLGVVRGAAGVVEGGKVSANVDSEMRFFASWYAVLGALFLRAARRPESETTIVRAGGAGFFLAACGRTLSARTVGPPNRLFRTLMWLEFALPAVLVPWQSAVRRRSLEARRTSV
jgi:hypothetical protein